MQKKVCHNGYQIFEVWWDSKTSLEKDSYFMIFLPS